VSTYQKAAATLRSAGFKASEFHRSGMVRGWGETTTGFNVRKGGGKFVAEVRHYISSNYRGDKHAEREREALDSYAEALEAAGFVVARSDRGDVLNLTWPTT
jgi:hypothetical protein